MIEPQIQQWQLQADCDIERLSSLLADSFQLEIESESPATPVTLLDDFDWAIWHADAVLLRVGRQQGWQLHEQDQVLEIDPVPASARFWWDLPPSPLTDRLWSLIDLRAVMPVAELTLATTHLALRNDDEKIVVRMTLTSIGEVDADGEQTSSPGRFLQLHGLRGYSGPFRQVVKAITPCLADELEEISLKQMLHSHGCGPEAPAVQDNFGITPDEPVEQAIRQMALQMLGVARANEAGVIDDIDTEFLHQYRVSLRKTRSLLNLMKAALPADMHLRLKSLLAELSGTTNMLRDLDVFLLERDYYQGMLPEMFADGVEEMFKLVARDREKARKAVQKSFRSSEHASLFDEVMSLLEGEPLNQTALAIKPVGKVASKKILNRYRRISLLGSEIHDGTPDEDVHELRIECKKLRYLMEFFAELYEAKRIRKLIKSLKKLQTILGNFNDYSVQKQFLADYESSHKVTAKLSAASNGLIAVLHQKQVSERNKVVQAFAAFNDEPTATAFQQLFGKAGEKQA